MEKQIKKAAATIQRIYAIFWLLPVMGIIAGETGGVWVGRFASQAQWVYLAECLSILLAAICVPVSLKLFAWVLSNRIDQATLPVALRLYVCWSGLRLLMLSLPVMAGLFTYYGMLSSKGLLCALIALTASLFCLPGEKRLRSELQINQE